VTTLRLNDPVAWRLHAEGWLLSLFLHGLVTGSAIWLVMDLRLAPQSEPFRWDVSVLATSSPLSSESSTPATPPAEERRPSEPVQTRQTAQEAVRQETEARTVTPIVPTEIRASRLVDQTIPSTDVPQQITPITATPAHLATEPSQPAVTNRDSAAETTDGTTAASIPVTQASARPAAAVSSKKGDYGWLAQALWSRVEKLKRYPHVARMNRREGRVLLRAVISDEGRLTQVAIVESSGHADLDRDALETLERAGPVPMPQPLGRSSVVIQIPISYTLR
jgi:protein TonB